jgi:amino-acid N-acetyltransferase
MKPLVSPIPFDLEVGVMLKSNHLPTEDLKPPSRALLFGYRRDRELLGLVGLELYGPVALLRSLVVAATQRGTGLGTALVEFAERHACQCGVGAVYLLTTTAEKFFESRGYVRAPRDEAPAAIASTDQFSNLCPSSSAFMSKRLGG